MNLSADPSGRVGRMPGPDGYFGERVAATYDASEHDMFDPAVIEPTIDFLAELAGDGGHSSSASAPAGSRCRSRTAAWRCTASSCRGRWPRGSGEAGRRRDRASRSATSRPRRVEGRSARLPRLQHDQEPDDTGRAGRVLPERRRASRARRLLRDRGRRARPAAAAARPDGSSSSTRARRTGASTSTTWRTRASISHHFEIVRRRSRSSSRCRSATCGRPSWT